MLSWFRKKKPSVPPPPAPIQPASPAIGGRAAALIERWDRTIAEVHARVQAMLAEAVAASEPIVERIESDLGPLVLPWNTITPRMREACEEVSEQWNAISDVMSDCEEFTHEMMDREGNKRDLATLELALLHDREYGGVMARAAEQMRRRALSVDAAPHACAHCGARLDRVRPVASALAVECGSCNAINTVHPSDALRAFAVVGAMHLAAEAARPANEAMRRLETRISQYRDAKDVPLALLVEFEQTWRAHWTTRLETEALHNPDEIKYVAMKLERHMKDVQRTLRRHWQWREHEARGG